MEEKVCIAMLEEHGIRPTVNRILMLKTLAAEGSPMSMKELEYKILTIDKSNVFRSLMLFKERHLVHVIEDGNGGVKYELCFSHDDEEDDDEHLHFFCEQCHRTICMHDTPLPQVHAPEGYELRSASFLLKGICPECLRHNGKR